MKAVLIESFGQPKSVVQFANRDKPTPQKGQVLVRMLASPINPSDLMMIRGQYGMLPKLPATPGFEGVGVVEASGPGLLGKFLVGKRVAALNGASGNWAEWAVVQAKQAFPMPPDIPIEQAAMFFVNPVTAYVMTRRVLAVPQGEFLLQTAAGSALGKMVIRLSQRFGFRTINVVRRPEQANELRALPGGEHSFATNGDDLPQRVKELTGGKGVRYAIDPVGGKIAGAALQSLAVGGRLLLYGSLSGESVQLSPREMLTQTAKVEGFWLARWMQAQSVIGKLRIVRSVARLVRERVLESDIEKKYSLAEIAAAVDHAERAARGGKIVLAIADS